MAQSNAENTFLHLLGRVQKDWIKFLYSCKTICAFGQRMQFADTLKAVFSYSPIVHALFLTAFSKPFLSFFNFYFIALAADPSLVVGFFVRRRYICAHPLYIQNRTRAIEAKAFEQTRPNSKWSKRHYFTLLCPFNPFIYK